MKGPTTDGSALFDINNKCHKCEHPMPLPSSHGKHCPDCGTRVMTYAEMQKGPPTPPAKCCPECGAEVGQKDKFCTECGTRVNKSWHK